MAYVSPAKKLLDSIYDAVAAVDPSGLNKSQNGRSFTVKNEAGTYLISVKKVREEKDDKNDSASE